MYLVLRVETMKYIDDDKKPAAIRVLALISVAAIILLWAIQPVTVTIPLGNQHTDWLFVDGMRYMTSDYNHSENPPIRYDDVLVRAIVGTVSMIESEHEHFFADQSPGDVFFIGNIGPAPPLNLI